ncbi:nucleotidyl transferase AbiEii/AbiGii toxin family protein [Candidatus Pacearchaeota archaeon]|nr:nucleotidyl transferase AbiEii/AbiGii toxin family protein [Candidatus Pacearchaeota archaeon]
MIPLLLKLKKESHKQIAKAQDIIVETLYETFNNATMHGGTAIWRCYQGNRFSEDIDVYLSRKLDKINIFFSSLEKKGFKLEKKKISNNSIYSKLYLDRTSTRFEALFRNVKSVLKEYETGEGNYITVYTLSPEDFLLEKINTYLKRRKIRDLYDIFFLLRLIKPSDKIRNEIKKFINNYEKPIDEKELKTIIITGLVPDTDKMVQYIKNF